MNVCTDPCALQEGDLAAYVDAPRPKDAALIERVRAHLARCPHCAAQLEAYRRTSALLHAALYRDSCPAPERLGLYQLHLLPAGEQLILARHVRECPHCQQDLQVLARAEAKPSLLERLRYAAAEIEAALLPAPTPQAAGVRGTAPAVQRFRVDDLDVLLGTQPGHQKGRRTLMGRLLVREPGHASDLGPEVWLVQEQDAWAAPIESRGTFRFADVELGQYDLGLEWRGQTAWIREVKIE